MTIANLTTQEWQQVAALLDEGQTLERAVAAVVAWRELA